MTSSLINYSSSIPTPSILNASFHPEHDYSHPTPSILTLNTPATPSNIHISHHPTPSHIHPSPPGSPLPTTHAQTRQPPLTPQQQTILRQAFTSRTTWSTLRTHYKRLPNSRSAMFKPDYSSPVPIYFITVTLNPRPNYEDSPQDSTPVLLFKAFNLPLQQHLDIQVYPHSTHPSSSTSTSTDDPSTSPPHPDPNPKHDALTTPPKSPPTPHTPFHFEVTPSTHNLETITALKTFISSPRRAVKFPFPGEYQVLWDEFKDYIERELSCSARDW
jgi:hypothetical protein